MPQKLVLSAQRCALRLSHWGAAPAAPHPYQTSSDDWSMEMPGPMVVESVIFLR